MKKSLVSALSLMLAAAFCGSTSVYALDTHPQGEVNFKIKNMTHDAVKAGSAKTFGPVQSAVVKDTFSHSGVLGEDSKAYIIRYDLGDRDIPAAGWGGKITLVKYMGKDKCGCPIYHRCTVKVMAGPHPAVFQKYGKLCKHVDVTATLHSGTTVYAKVKYE